MQTNEQTALGAAKPHSTGPAVEDEDADVEMAVERVEDKGKVVDGLRAIGEVSDFHVLVIGGAK